MNRNFGQTLNCLPKTKIFSQIDCWSKTEILSQIELFVKKGNFVKIANYINNRKLCQKLNIVLKHLLSKID